MSNLTSRLLVLAIAAAGAAVSVSACSGPDRGEKLTQKVGTRASPGSFRNARVSAVFEKRCGSIDCHGTVDRSLRIYSKDGLRLPDKGNVPGGTDTTADEISANYQSLMNLEPERSNEVIDGADPETTLLFVKKPLETEKHKGGPALKKGDVAYNCIVSWLTEEASKPVNASACGDAARFPKN
jgi:hypothetical protein